ncbi:hypothetical protein [Actinomyces gerencseriae]|uniref:hypothetical protein n=1 Tax=Actinomyces gerencseriae TaxID=52769 RepID=UPI0003FC0708|nr:hypothetical protein [Actinomyces gerencseriae]
MNTSNDDPGTTKCPGRTRSRVWWQRGAGVLLVVAFAYATIYGCGTFLIEGINPNTKPERFTGPRPDIPITQARTDTLNLLLTIYDTLTREHIVDAWVPPAPGPGGGGYQARIGGEYNEPVCPEGTTNERYFLARAARTTPRDDPQTDRENAVIEEIMAPHGFINDTRRKEYRRLSDGARIYFSGYAIVITTGCHPGTPFQDWPTGTEAVPDYLRTTGRGATEDRDVYPDTDTWPTQTPTNPIPSPATDQPPPQATPPQATPTPTKTPRPERTPRPRKTPRPRTTP